MRILSKKSSPDSANRLIFPDNASPHAMKDATGVPPCYAENSLPSKEKLSPHAEASLWHIILLVVCDMVKYTLQSVKLGTVKHLYGIDGNFL